MLAMAAQACGQESTDMSLSADTVGITHAGYTTVSLADTLAAADTIGIEAVVAQAVDDAVKAMQPATFRPDPTRALWLALVLPGGGQIYNRKFWKLPIVYGGYLGCFYALSWNNQMLRDYSQAYLDIMDDDPDTKSYEKMLPMGYSIAGRESQFQTIFKNKKNYYRRYRDMSIFAFFAVYAISVIDAYVDAELSSFDISPDLSLHLSPTVLTTTTPSRCGSTHGGAPMQRHTAGSTPHETALGMSLNLTF